MKRKLRKLNASDEHKDNEIQAIEDEFKEKAEAVLQAVRLQLGILEVSLLITGTILWGFGDLFFKLAQ